MILNDIFNILFLSAQSIESAGKARIASALTLKGNIISFGFNQMKTHPFQARFSTNPDCIYLHSEIAAIQKGLRKVEVEDLKKCSLHICRAKRSYRNGPFITGLSLPCLGCMRAITAFEIKKVFYSTENCMEFTCL